MNVYTEITKNPQTDYRSFRDYAEVFFKLNEFEMDWSSKEECELILESADHIADNLSLYEGDELQTRMLSLGSIFGEAFITVTDGFWLYSSIPERWVVSFLHTDGSDVNANIFSKLEKYLENGEEDSLSYFFKHVRAPLLI